MESQECQIIEGGCGDFIMVPGLEKPASPARSAPAPTTSRTSRRAASPSDPQLRAASTGGAATRPGRTSSASAARRDVEKPAGEWNRMEVICDGDTITIILNGYVVNVGTKSSLTRGKILFQSEGAEILFRKIEIRPLIR